MLVVKIITLVTLVAYTGIMLYSIIGHLKFPSFQTAQHPATPVSVIVCARNEEAYMANCLTGILSQDFPKPLLELILVDDASTDRTRSIAETILKSSGIKHILISNTQKLGKKQSLTNAIQHSTGRLIVTRDADTYTTTGSWLSTMCAYYEATAKELIIAPVTLRNDNSFVAQLQNSECDALAIITSGFAVQQNAFLCNGANLAFTRAAFEKVNGYSSHLHIASGDDVLLLEDIKKTSPEQIGYLKSKEATVYSYPQPSLRKVLDQKIRWAAKAGVNPNLFNRLFAVLVLLVHVFTILFLAKAIFTHHLGAFGLFFIFSRFFIDFLLLFLASRYFKKSVIWWWLPVVWIAYSFLVITVGVLSWFYKPKWK